MALNNFKERLQESIDKLSCPEQMLGKGLNMPFNPSNSGSRKILYSVQSEHVIPIKHNEPPIISTGYENRFGDRSSSIISAQDDMELITKIPVYSFAPNGHYYAIFRNRSTGVYCAIERKAYEHISESHGIHYTYDKLDSMVPGDVISKNENIRSSESYDEYGNRCDGANVNVVYMATDKNMEDSVIVSESATHIFATEHVHKITIPINANDIGLNRYCDEENPYKILPDVGEEIVDGIVCAIRRENKEEALYTQSGSMLKKLLISDDKYTTNGTIVDINVLCNNPDILEVESNVQLKKYYEEKKRFSHDVIDAVNNIYDIDPTAKFDYQFNKLKYNCDKILADTKYIKDNVFNNIVLEIYIVDEDTLSIGDKVSDRYGGKGVVSYILPDHMMPRDKYGEVAHVIMNQSTCVNRLNPGQLFETSLTHIGKALIQNLNNRPYDPDYALDEILRYVRFVVPQQADVLEEYMAQLDPEDREVFVDSILSDGFIKLIPQPIQDNMTIQKLKQMYEYYNWIKLEPLRVPLIDSNNNIRYTMTRRGIILSKKYMFRLKQYAEDKFSSTSMSATNIRNQNTRSKNAKRYKSLHSNTPIAMGNMEIDDLAHIGMEYVVSVLMIHSVSPRARRLTEQLLTGDPFDYNVRIDNDSSNRSVEILNTYLKTIGQRLVFRKKAKVKEQLVSFRMVNFAPDSPVIKPLVNFKER